jgi:hypothetical protein
MAVACGIHLGEAKGREESEREAFLFEMLCTSCAELT